jgi:DNA-binding PadR family transcriptional regulator
LAVLAQLHTEHYGYTLRKELADRGLDIDEGTLYPLLRRLESQGLLVSEWREQDKRDKRFYRLAPAGKRVLKSCSPNGTRSTPRLAASSAPLDRWREESTYECLRGLFPNASPPPAQGPAG